MNILITGGTGFIGQFLVPKLLSEYEAQITILTRNIDKASFLYEPHICLITELNSSVISQQDIVINLAGESIADKRWSSDQKETICQSRWQITEQLTELIAESNTPPRCFISGSAIGIYGRQDNEPIDENFTASHNEFTIEVCQPWESIAQGAQSNNTRVCLLRTGIVLGKEHGALAKMLPPFKLALGGSIGTGQQMMSWIHINDMVNAILYIINNESVSGAINLTSPNAVTNKVFSQSLAKALHRPAIFPMPAFIAKLLFGEMSDLLLYGQNVVPNKLLEAGFTFEYNHLSNALEEILK